MKFIKSNLIFFNISILAVVLLISSFFLPPIFLDLTESKIHSLSTHTVNTIKDLPEIVNIKVYISGNLPPEATPIKENIDQFLKNIQSLNPSKIRIKYFDPSSSPEIKDEAELIGIAPFNFSSVKNDKLEVSSSYMGLSISSGDKKEVLPYLGDVSNFEYYFLTTLARLSGKTLTKVSILPGKSTVLGQDQYLTQFIKSSFNLIPLSSWDFDISSSEVFILFDPATDLDTKTIGILEKLLNSKKSLIILADRFQTDGNTQSKKIDRPNFDYFLQNHGIKFIDKFIADSSSAIVNMSSGKNSYLVQYPYWLKIVPEKMLDSPILSQINSLVIPWVSPIEITDNSKILFSSSDGSWLTPDISVETLSKTKAIDQQSYPIASINIDTKFCFVADSDFIKDNFVISDKNNLIFFLNLIDYLSNDPSLLTIRSKQIFARPVEQLSENVKSILKYSFVASPVVVLLVIFFSINILRKKSHEEC